MTAPGPRGGPATAAPPRARKRFGQHFLHDPAVIERIVAAVRAPDDARVIEIGPGPGAITGPLLARFGRLAVVEVDRDLAAALPARLGHPEGLEIHRADALELDLGALCPARPVHLVGNLPYNISTPLLFHLLGQSARIVDMLFMLQAEVVERLVAAPGERAYGRLGVMVRLYCDAEKLFDIGPGAFSPPPRVRSAMVRLTPLATPREPVEDLAAFRALVAHLFSRRRKTLRAALKGRVDAAAIERAGIDPGARPGTLTLAEFARLARLEDARDINRNCG